MICRAQWTGFAILVALLCAGPARSADEPSVDGRVGFGAVGGFTLGSFDARAMLDLRLDAANLGGKPVGIAADGDLFFDLDDLLLRTYRLTDLNLHVRPGAGKLTMVLGRQRAADTTEELVDGVGVRVELGRGFHMGGYGGLIPDPFTTLATLETGGAGAVLGYRCARFHLETATGFSARATGFDHGFVSLSAMGKPLPVLSMYGRAKMQGYAGTPGFGVADLFASMTLKPAPILRIRALYNAYSSERYVDLLDRNPALSRFAARADDLDLIDELPSDTLDTTLYHQFGGDVGLRDGEHHGTLGARFRYRLAPDPDDHYLRADLYGGAVQLGQGSADLIGTGRFIRAGGHNIGQAEIGLETTAARRKLDLGAYLMFSGSPAVGEEARPSLGIYGDLFTAWWLGKGWSLAAALRLGWEANEESAGVGVDGLLKVTYRFHRKGKAEATHDPPRHL